MLVGDGASDYKAALLADVVFAKSTLAVWCARNGIVFVPFTTLRDVLDALVPSLRRASLGSPPCGSRSGPTRRPCSPTRWRRTSKRAATSSSLVGPPGGGDEEWAEMRPPRRWLWSRAETARPGCASAGPVPVRRLLPTRWRACAPRCAPTPPPRPGANVERRQRAGDGVAAHQLPSGARDARRLVRHRARPGRGRQHREIGDRIVTTALAPERVAEVSRRLRARADGVVAELWFMPESQTGYPALGISGAAGTFGGRIGVAGRAPGRGGGGVARAAEPGVHGARGRRGVGGHHARRAARAAGAHRDRVPAPRSSAPRPRASRARPTSRAVRPTPVRSRGIRSRPRTARGGGPTTRSSTCGGHASASANGVTSRTATRGPQPGSTRARSACSPICGADR